VISIQQLRAISRRTGLNLYQQEKDYLLKLFLFAYYKANQDAVFKGGTSLRYLYGIDRFSEDLDFNLRVDSGTFRTQVSKVLKELNLMGIEAGFKREEEFKDAFTCEINYKGPLYEGPSSSRNKIRIDAGTRSGMLKEPEWRLIASEYPETKERFLVLVMNVEEMLVEKIAALTERKKGRDLYDVWYLISTKVAVNRELLSKRSQREFDPHLLVSKEAYERDMRRLTSRVIPYEQVVKDITMALGST